MLSDRICVAIDQYAALSEASATRRPVEIRACVVSSLRPDADDERALLRSLTQLSLDGAAVDWRAQLERHRPARVSLPEADSADRRSAGQGHREQDEPGDRHPDRGDAEWVQLLGDPPTEGGHGAEEEPADEGEQEARPESAHEKAASPVIAWPRISWWISFVPSYV